LSHQTKSEDKISNWKIGLDTGLHQRYINLVASGMAARLKSRFGGSSPDKSAQAESRLKSNFYFMGILAFA